MNSQQFSSLRLFQATSMSVAALLFLLWSLSAPASHAALGTWYVSPQGDDDNPCSTNTAPCRRIQAVLDKAGFGDTINVAHGVYTDSAGTVAQILQDVTLRGGWDESFTVRDPAAYPSVLDAQGGGPVMVISGSVGLNPIVPAIEGFVLTNGNGTGVVGCDAPGAGGCGGGIFGTNATPRILDNVITNNVATASGDGYGGGIYLQGALVGGTIEGNTIVSNMATISSTAFISGWGGGICLYYIAADVYDNLIQDNVASAAKGWGYGGGIILRRSAGRVISNVVSGNIASTVATSARSGFGGGISVYQSQTDEASVLDNEIRANTASLSGHGWGGGIQIASSRALVGGNRIIANIGGASDSGSFHEHRGDGGGIYARYGSWTIRDNHILSNTGATTGLGFGGGCQLEYGDVILERNVVAGNTAAEGVKSGWGGGINLLHCDDSVVRKNTIRDNVASLGGTGYGGGLSVRYSPLTVEGNLILSNWSSRGGGVHVDRSAPVTFTNNVIAHNQAQAAGGGIRVFGDIDATIVISSHAILIHNTLAENGLGGGGEGVCVAQYATVAMTNNIVVSHSYGIFCETSSSAATADYTLFYGNSIANVVGAVTSSHQIAGAPRFVTPVEGDFHIRPTSAARDSGTSTWVNSDLDGDVRPVGDEVDIGADEFCSKTYLPMVIRSGS